jgi:hypothetical protein
MGEQEVIGQLLGPSGGTFALGMLVGSVLMWFANLKVINPYVQRAHTAEMSAMQARIAALELRIKELEKFETNYMAILEAHSSGTLHPIRGQP